MKISKNNSGISAQLYMIVTLIDNEVNEYTDDQLIDLVKQKQAYKAMKDKDNYRGIFKRTLKTEYNILSHITRIQDGNI